MIALLSEFAKSINAEQAFDYDEHEKHARKIAGKICSDVVSKLIKSGTGLDVKSAVKYVNSIRNIAKEKRIKYKDVNDKLPIEILIEQIQNDIGTLTSFENRGIILMVDELDRCLPDYAIKVLERLHHFCENTRIIQILALNKKEMSGSIAKAFGYPNADADKVEYFANHYMQKFIDMTVSLNNGELDDPETVLFSSLECYFAEYDNLDKTFVAEFTKKILSDIPMRNLKQIVKSAAALHGLSLSEYPEKEEKFSYALMIAEILECTQVYYFGGRTNIETDFSKMKSIHIALKVPSDSTKNNHLNFERRVQQFFSFETSMINPFYTMRKDVFEFYMETPIQKVVRLFTSSEDEKIGYKTILPEYLQKDLVFFTIFRKNLDLLKIQ